MALSHEDIRSVFAGGGAAATTSPITAMRRTASLTEVLADEQRTSNQTIIKLLREQNNMIKKGKGGGAGGALDFVDDLLVAGWLKKMFSGALLRVRGIGQMVKRFGLGVSSFAIGYVKNAFGFVTNTIKAAGAPLARAMTGVLGGMTNRLISGAVKAVSGLGFLGKGLTSFFGMIGGAGKAVTAALSGIGGVGALSGISKFIGGGAKLLGKLFWPITAIMGLFDAVKGWDNADQILGKPADLKGRILSSVGSVLNGITFGLTDWISQQFGWKNLASGLNNSIDGAVRFFQQDIGTIASQIVTGLGGMVVGAANSLWSMIPGSAAIAAMLPNIGNSLIELGKAPGKMVQSMIDFVNANFPSISSLAVQLGNSIWQGFTSVVDGIGEAIRGVFGEAWDNFVKGASSIDLGVLDGRNWQKWLSGQGGGATPPQRNWGKLTGPAIGATPDPTVPKTPYSGLDTSGLVSPTATVSMAGPTVVQVDTSSPWLMTKEGSTYWVQSLSNAIITAVNPNAGVNPLTTPTPGGAGSGMALPSAPMYSPDQQAQRVAHETAARAGIPKDLAKFYEQIKTGYGAAGSPGGMSTLDFDRIVSGDGSSGNGSNYTSMPGSSVFGSGGGSGGGGGASPTGAGGSLGALIMSGESVARGYNDYNRGSGGVGRGDGRKYDFGNMTLGEIMEAQSLGRGDPNRLFAVGKYQIIPETMKEAVKNLGIDPGTKFTPELQEKLFRDYLIDEKRPAIKSYITGGGSLDAASLALSQEFASVANPRTGSSYYGNGNHASISPSQTAEVLQAERAKYAALTKGGMDPDKAWLSLSDAIVDPGGSPTMPGTSDANAYLKAHTDKDASHIDGMDPVLQQRLAAMMQDAPDSIKGKLGVYSGYRSPERQKELFDEAVARYGSEAAARRWVAPPGKSQHNHGNAADLSFNGASLKNAPPEVVDWLHQNSGKYGLKFPLDNENWHIETQETRQGAPFTGTLPTFGTPFGGPMGGPGTFSPGSMPGRRYNPFMPSGGPGTFPPGSMPGMPYSPTMPIGGPGTFRSSGLPNAKPLSTPNYGFDMGTKLGLDPMTGGTVPDLNNPTPYQSMGMAPHLRDSYKDWQADDYAAPFNRGAGPRGNGVARGAASAGAMNTSIAPQPVSAPVAPPAIGNVISKGGDALAGGGKVDISQISTMDELALLLPNSSVLS